MKTSCNYLGVGLLLVFSASNLAFSQSGLRPPQYPSSPSSHNVSNTGSKLPDNIQISGRIYTEDLQSVELVSVNLFSPGQSYPTFITTQNGEYTFNPNLVLPTDITVTAERDDNYRNGVSTLDLLLIQKHLLGKEIITSPYDLIAADANNSQSVSAIDLVELKKLILGIYMKLPNNKSWRFVDKNYNFQDNMHPGANGETITLTVNGDVNDADFIAIKVGDVNHTAKAHFQPIITRESYPTIPLTVLPEKYRAGETVTIDFSMGDISSLNGFQFTLSSPDLEFLGASSDHIDLNEDDYALFGDKMTMSWFTAEGQRFDPSDIFFTVKAVAKRSGNLQQSLQLNSEITDAEMYSSNNDIFIPKILFKAKDEEPLTLLAPEPNPWSTTCAIPFYIQHDGHITFNVYTVNGAKIFSSEKYYSAGYHEIDLEAADMAADGLLFYMLQSATESSTGKMLVLKQ